MAIAHQHKVCHTSKFSDQDMSPFPPPAKTTLPVYDSFSGVLLFVPFHHISQQRRSEKLQMCQNVVPQACNWHRPFRAKRSKVKVTRSGTVVISSRCRFGGDSDVCCADRLIVGFNCVTADFSNKTRGWIFHSV